MNIMNVNSNIEQVNQLKSQFTIQISQLLKEASAINLKFEKIANLKVSNAKEVEILGNEFINARKNYLDQMISISKSTKEKANTLIKNSEYRHRTDNEGDPNKFPKPGKPEKPETNTPKTPEEPKTPNEPKTPPENTTPPKEPIVKPTIG